MNPRALRLLRGVIVTATAVAISSVAHVAAGGGSPGLIGLATALVVGSALGTALMRPDRLTPARTAATIAGGQLVFHLVFAWGQTVSTSQAAPHVHAHAALPVQTATDALATHDASAMLLAHVGAGLLSLAVLLLEQRLLDRVVVAAQRALARLVEPTAPLAPLGTLPCLGRPADASLPTLAHHRALILRRGPPAPLLSV